MTTVDQPNDRLRDDQLANGGRLVPVTRTDIGAGEPNRASPTDRREPTGVAPQWTDDQIDAYLGRWDRLAHEVAKTWPEGVSAFDAVLEQRREL